MSIEAIAVFTARSPERILREGGSDAWVLDPARARKCRYLVCTQNQHHPDRDFSEASEPHGAAFLIGKISDVVPALREGAKPRWRICFREYARHVVLDSWKGWQNPVRYTTLDEMGIRFDDLVFKSTEKSMDEVMETSDVPMSGGEEGVAPLSMQAAKPRLAAFYGVLPEAIEITIRG